MSGCISEDETERRFIDDESDLIDYEDAGICGDLDGDGELDCPLSGYIPDTMPWWCNSTASNLIYVKDRIEACKKLGI